MRSWSFAYMVAAIAVSLLLGSQSIAGAADIKVVSSQALAEVMPELIPEFERRSGHRVTISFGTTGAIVDRLERGETADVVILTEPGLRRVAAGGKVADQPTVVARSQVGVAVKAGASKPDIRSADALRRSLLLARSIAYPDPASGGASGVQFAELLQKLGIAETVKPKVRLVPSGASTGELAARGEVELAVQMVSELLPVPGIEVVGPLPSDILAPTVLQSAVASAPAEPDAARAFVGFMTSPQAMAVLEAKGLAPH